MCGVEGWHTPSIICSSSITQCIMSSFPSICGSLPLPFLHVLPASLRLHLRHLLCVIYVISGQMGTSICTAATHGSRLCHLASSHLWRLLSSHVILRLAICHLCTSTSFSWPSSIFLLWFGTWVGPSCVTWNHSSMRTTLYEGHKTTSQPSQCVSHCVSPCAILTGPGYDRHSTVHGQHSGSNHGYKKNQADHQEKCKMEKPVYDRSCKTCYEQLECSIWSSPACPALSPCGPSATAAHPWMRLSQRGSMTASCYLSWKLPRCSKCPSAGMLLLFTHE